MKSDCMNLALVMIAFLNVIYDKPFSFPLPLSVFSHNFTIVLLDMCKDPQQKLKRSCFIRFFFFTALKRLTPAFF